MEYADNTKGYHAKRNGENEMISNEEVQHARILIVDDNQTNVTLLQGILSSAGYTSVLGITDPREVMELYKAYRPDLILLDINMPYLNGYQIMEQLKVVEQSNSVPILVLTALQDKETLIRSLRSGAKDFLTKPLDQTETLMRIRSMLETRCLYNKVRFQNDLLEQKVKERTRKLSDANKEIENFVYLTSHDLKEPLFTIGGYASKLSLTYNDVLDDKGKKFIERIKDNVEKMNRKIHDIMDVLKMGKVEYDLRGNDSGTIIKDVIDSLQDKILENKIKIIFQDEFPNLYCDKARMKDVFTNLLTNAIKFMGNDKYTQTSGETGDITIGCKKNGEHYKFFIEDAGIGIQEDYQEQIFKIFTRLNDIDVEGTGVGLSIVKKIVERHNGDIWVESPVCEGRGSRFCFTIPIERRVMATAT